MRSHRLIFLFVPGLALSQVAFAVDLTVGDTTAGDDYDTLEEAITAVVAAGAATTGVPHTITITSANYLAGESNLNGIPTSIDDGTDDIDLVIASDATAGTLSFTIPALVSHADLRLEHLVIEGDLVDSCVHSASACTRGIAAYYVGPVTMHDADLEGDDLILQQGTVTGQLWSSWAANWGTVDGVVSLNGDVTLSNFDASSFTYFGGAIVLRDDWYDNSVADRHSFSLTDCTIGSNYGSEGYDGRFYEYGRAPGVHSVGNASGSILRCDFDANIGDHVVFADTADVSVDLSNFDGNHGNAIYMQGGVRYEHPYFGGEGMIPEDQQLTVANSTFTDNEVFYYGCGGAIAVVPWENMYWARRYGKYECEYPYENIGSGPVTVDLIGTTFEDNRSYDGADIYYDDPAGVLTVTTMQSTGNRAYDMGGSVFLQGWGRFTDASWDGGEGGYTEYGGSIAASGELECLRCSFDRTWADIGGAVALYSEEQMSGYPYGYGMGFTTWASFEDSEFLNNIGYFGSALAVTQDVVATVEDSQFLANVGYLTGAIVVAPVGPSNNNGDEVAGQQYPPGWGYYDQPPAELTVARSSFEDNISSFGGAFYIGGWNGLVTFEDSTFDRNQATSVGALSGQLVGPMGGTGVVEPGNALAIRGGTIRESYAESWGGVLFSGVPVPWVESFFYGYQGPRGGLNGGSNWGSPQPRECGADYTPYTDRPYGADIVLDGVQVADSVAQSASVAYFGFHDHVRVLGSEFTGNVAEDDATFYAENLERLEFSCNTFCSNDVTGRGSGIYIFDDGLDYNLVGQFNGGGVYPVGPTRDVRYVFENNVWQNNTDNASGGVIEFEFCDGGVGSDTGIDTADSGFDSGIDTGFDTGLDSGFDTAFDTGTPVADARGRLSIVNNTFVENEGTNGLIYGSAADVRLGVGNNLFEDGAIGVNVSGSRYVFGGYNLWHNLADDSEGDAEMYFPDLTRLIGDPIYLAHQAGQCDSSLPLDPTSPGFREGNPLLEDWDGQRSSVGAYGGPHACIPDIDGDDFNAYLDCDDAEFHVNPGMPEIPYDGIDQDCDGADECDLDGDTYLAEAPLCGGDDCNDFDASINPGATEIPYDGIDQDCDGVDDCDADDDGAISTDCGGNDCDDDDDTVYPGAPEIPDDGIDQDCDGDDAFADADDDGFDSPEFGGDDCDDTDATVNPGGTEIPYDGIDQDCNGEDDCDADGDGSHATEEIAASCDGEDCDDSDPDIRPGAEDTPYDGIDQDCDGIDLCDVDGDGFDAPDGDCGGDDCDDNDASVNPGATENPATDIDEDCDGEAQAYVTGGGLCGCSTTSPAAPWSAAGLMALMLAFVRRRRVEE